MLEMEIAMDPLNESDRARASSSPNSPTKKRTFSELEGPNAPVSNNNKLLKHCDEGQENHAQSWGDLVVTLDKQPAPAVPTSHTPSTPPRPQHQSAAAMSNLAQKKPKLSPSSKDARKKEKEEKDRLKNEEKARREAEKKTRDEERKKKETEKEEERKKRELEREEKKKQKEEERQAREDEKRKKEEEKSKKERVSEMISFTHQVVMAYTDE